VVVGVNAENADMVSKMISAAAKAACLVWVLGFLLKNFKVFSLSLIFDSSVFVMI
jgi:hypothetical protein